jgi:hypothetical protein
VQDRRNKSAHVGLAMTTLTKMQMLSLCHEHEKLQKQKLSQRHSKEKNHKECKLKSNPRLKTQRHKARTRHMLKDDLKITLF